MSDTLREKAERRGRRETQDGPVWELPSWDDVLDLLARLGAAEERQRALEEVSEAAAEDHAFHVNGRRMMADGELYDCPVCAALARLPAAGEGT